MSHRTLPEKMLYSRDEAARALSISVRKLEQLIQSSQLRVVRIGRRVLISSAALEEFVASQLKTFSSQVGVRQPRKAIRCLNA